MICALTDRVCNALEMGERWTLCTFPTTGTARNCQKNSLNDHRCKVVDGRDIAERKRILTMEKVRGKKGWMGRLSLQGAGGYCTNIEGLRGGSGEIN